MNYYIRPTGRDDVIGIRNCDDPSLDGHGISNQAMRIAAAMVALVVVEHREKL